MNSKPIQFARSRKSIDLDSYLRRSDVTLISSTVDNIEEWARNVSGFTSKTMSWNGTTVSTIIDWMWKSIIHGLTRESTYWAVVAYYNSEDVRLHLWETIFSIAMIFCAPINPTIPLTVAYYQTKYRGQKDKFTTMAMSSFVSAVVTVANSGKTKHAENIISESTTKYTHDDNWAYQSFPLGTIMSNIHVALLRTFKQRADLGYKVAASSDIMGSCQYLDYVIHGLTILRNRQFELLPEEMETLGIDRKEALFTTIPIIEDSLIVTNAVPAVWKDWLGKIIRVVYEMQDITFAMECLQSALLVVMAFPKKDATWRVPIFVVSQDSPFYNITQEIIHDVKQNINSNAPLLPDKIEWRNSRLQNIFRLG
jgi:hypothetical protein